MSGLSAREAGNQVGLSKQAILKAIHKGTLSAEKDGNGEWRIEPAELFRVYPPPATGDGDRPTPEEMAGLRRENELLRDQVADLRRRLDTEAEERRQVQARLTALLIDQRPQPEPRRRWWPWRRGK